MDTAATMRARREAWLTAGAGTRCRHGRIQSFGFDTRGGGLPCCDGDDRDEK